MEQQVSYSMNGDVVIVVNAGVKLHFGYATYNVAHLILSKDELAQIKKQNPNVKFVLTENRF